MDKPEQNQTISRIFTIEGDPDAERKMAQLTEYARVLGGFTLQEVVGVPQRLEAGPQSAASYLRTLLSEPGPYRLKWEMCIARNTTPDGINQAGVARVLADWLNSQLPTDAEAVDARQLKDRVARVFAGKHLSAEVLELFVEAFGFSDEHRNTLIAAYLNLQTDTNN